MSETPLKDGTDLVRQEYFFLQQTVEDYQRQSLDIKKLSLGLTGAVAFLKGAVANADTDVALLSVLVLALGFWVLDWLWKEFQRNNYPRLADIEADFAHRFEPSPRITAQWHGSVVKRRRFELKSFIWLHVCLPHAPVAAISVTALLARHFSQLLHALAGTGTH